MHSNHAQCILCIIKTGLIQSAYNACNLMYTGCPKKAERSIFGTLKFENIAYFYIIR